MTRWRVQPCLYHHRFGTYVSEIHYQFVMAVSGIEGNTYGVGGNCEEGYGHLRAIGEKQRDPVLVLYASGM
jgi:hypothetical protein